MKQIGIFHEAARVAFVMGQYHEAIEYLQSAAKYEKNNLIKNGETFSDIARCIYELQDKEQIENEGLEMVSKALTIDKNCANAWLNKGNIHYLMVQPAEAKQCYEKAL